MLYNSKNYHQISSLSKKVDEVIDDLDVKLNKVLVKQEKEYLEGYNKYVKKKEAELGKMIVELINERNNNNNSKDKQIKQLQLTIHSIKQDQIKQEDLIEKFRREVAKWKTNFQALKQENRFIESQIKETKKHNQILKLAISRLQIEFGKIKEKMGDTFLTQLDHNDAGEDKKDLNIDQILEILKSSSLDTNQISMLENIQLLDASTSLSNLETHKTPLDKSMTTASLNLQAKRKGSMSPMSKYRCLETHNIKFENFISILFQSKMEKDQMQKEIIECVRAIETKYSAKLVEMRSKIERERKKRIYQDSIKVNEATEK